MRRVSRAERRASELLRLDSSLLHFISQLHRVAEDEQAGRFEIEAGRLLKEFQSRSSGSIAVLREIASDSERHAILVGGIRAMLESLPSRVASLVALANGGDWVLSACPPSNQTDSTDDVVAALMGQADEDLMRARQRLAEDLEKAQTRATNTLAFTGVLSDRRSPVGHDLHAQHYTSAGKARPGRACPGRRRFPTPDSSSGQ